MSFGVTPTGFARKPLNVILSELEAAAVAEFGPDAITSSQSPFGQLLGLMANFAARNWEVAEAAYHARDPDQSEGLQLDMLATMRILSRGLEESDEELRQAITNQGRARVDLQDLVRAVSEVDGVTYTQVFVNDTASVDVNGLEPHSVGVAVIGGDDDEVARTVRAYVVPGIGTSGNVRVDTEIEGVCRTVWLVRPAPVAIGVDVQVTRRNDRLGCPPADLVAIAEALVAQMNGARRLVNGEDVETYMLRSAIEAFYPNVQVVSVTAYRLDDTGSSLPISIAFDEIASFSIDNVSVVNYTP